MKVVLSGPSGGPRSGRALEGRVALVTEGGGELGRAIALALAARGVRIVVTGPVERALGETVGEIAYQGGKARHVPAAAGGIDGLRAAAARAVEVFGGLDLVIATEADPGARALAFEAAPGARRVALVPGAGTGPESVGGGVREVPVPGESDADRVAEAVLEACVEATSQA